MSAPHFNHELGAKSFMKRCTFGDRLRVKEAAELAGVSMAMIYRWFGEEKAFLTWTVKRRGYSRGIRYIDKESFIAFLKTQREAIQCGPDEQHAIQTPKEVPA